MAVNELLINELGDLLIQLNITHAQRLFCLGERTNIQFYTPRNFGGQTFNSQSPELMH